jgi:2-amino-4-hydroxy-6-hydroxymethyldihydropteridine diphosphokinase
VNECIVGLGANLGDPLAAIVAAVDRLARRRDVRLRRCSAIYRSAPVGPAGQPDYLNAAISIGTTLAPAALLAELHRIEHDAGRQRDTRWGARTLDLDLLMVAGVESQTPQLTLPHPHIGERNFVLAPLIDLLGPEYDFRGLRLADWLERAPANRLELTDFALAPDRDATP